MDHAQTARWAQPNHHPCPDADGLVCMTRQRDVDLALLLCSDRAEAALAATRMRTALLGNDVLGQATMAMAMAMAMALARRVRMAAC